jgi:hypothetical protein
MTDQRPYNALAQDMIRQEREAARRKAQYRDRETARWFAPFFSISLAIALLIAGYAISRNEVKPAEPQFMTGPTH